MTDSPDPPHGYYISPHRQACHAAAATLLLLLPLLLHAAPAARAMHCRFCSLSLPCDDHQSLAAIIIFVHYDILFTTRNLNMLSNCRTAGRYATPAALYLFLILVVLARVRTVTPLKQIKKVHDWVALSPEPLCPCPLIRTAKPLLPTVAFCLWYVYPYLEHFEIFEIYPYI